MRLSHLLWIGPLLLLWSGTPAAADVIFNNFGPGDHFQNGGRILTGEAVEEPFGDVDQATSFIVGPSIYYLTSISVGISVASEPDIGTGPLDIIIAADAAGLPGATLGTASLNVNSGGTQIVTGAFGGQELSANTRYWVIADARDSFDGAWFFNSIGDIGDTAGRSNGGPWTLRVDDTRYVTRVEGRPFAESVPEPSTGALLAGAVLGLLGFRACRGQKRGAGKLS